MQDTRTPEEHVAEQYELGRSDGVADGAQDYDWHQARIDLVRSQIPEELEFERLHGMRQTRAYALGYARGYREATAGAPDGGGLNRPVAELPR